ncbi:T9SS type A sorting domain-containing protein [Hymenobacter cheonanensis]|uniref:T9SS type A sorting domain-containing protein n=1 Tax=Hymenobacter sp. CA2-7 TaxID=3063993 RepID=UPI0027127AA9|nr:T9SS type A sorting domain-containing protein [Hymenobacter sp. CA2-7]MDO7886604.1 T9SS type A sorting domain-containing protein [Hymenobacter sp. CA2-7]
MCPGSHITLTPRDPSPGALLEAAWKVYRVDVTPAQLVYTQTDTGADAANSTLYFQVGTVVGARYEAQLQERNTCGVGPVTAYQLEIIDCAGGYEPFFTAPGQPATESAAAYPNPAGNDLTLEQGGGPVRLTNAHGQAVRSQIARPGRVQLDTRRLPAGLYFLEMRDARGKAVRKQIRIVH